MEAYRSALKRETENCHWTAAWRVVTGCTPVCPAVPTRGLPIRFFTGGMPGYVTPRFPHALRLSLTLITMHVLCCFDILVGERLKTESVQCMSETSMDVDPGRDRRDSIGGVKCPLHIIMLNWVILLMSPENPKEKFLLSPLPPQKWKRDLRP